MKKLAMIILVLLLATSLSQAQNIVWTSFEHLSDSLRKEKRPLLIFIEADWCKFCKMQHQITFNDNDIIKVLAEEFYSLKLDGENENPIRFLNRMYVYNPTTGLLPWLTIWVKMKKVLSSPPPYY